MSKEYTDEEKKKIKEKALKDGGYYDENHIWNAIIIVRFHCQQSFHHLLLNLIISFIHLLVFLTSLIQEVSLL
jgi:hypothetical protein